MAHCSTVVWPRGIIVVPSYKTNLNCLQLLMYLHFAEGWEFCLMSSMFSAAVLQDREAVGRFCFLYLPCLPCFCAVGARDSSVRLLISRWEKCTSSPVCSLQFPTSAVSQFCWDTSLLLHMFETLFRVSLDSLISLPCIPACDPLSSHQFTYQKHKLMRAHVGCSHTDQSSLFLLVFCNHWNS